MLLNVTASLGLGQILWLVLTIRKT